MSSWSLVAWLSNASLLTVAIFVFASMTVASVVGHLIRRRVERARQRRGAEGDEARSAEGHLVSGTVGLLALLLAFTFGLALDRYETRRELVIKEANAIGTSYLRAQMLDEPHRTRLSGLLVAYTKNRIELGTRGASSALMTLNDRLLTQIWAAVVAAGESAQSRNMIVPITSTYNELIDLDTERKVARQTRVPGQVLLVLYFDLLITALVLGYVLEGTRGRVAAAVLFILMTASVGVIVDLNRPLSGYIRESQEPMLMLLDSLEAQPPIVFDQYKARPEPR
jgi:hypothetical protein